MTSRQESKLNMYRAVKLLLDNNIAIISPVVAFLGIYNAFKAKLTTFLITVASEAEVISGITIDKTVAKQNLSQNAADIAAITYAYASSINNNDLKQSANFAYSDLFRIKDDLLAPTCQNIHDVTFNVLVALADYGITAPMLTAFQDNITAYASSVPKPRNAKNLKETYSENIKLQIKDIDKLLKDEMDKTIRIFKPTHPDLISNYKFARIILDPAHTVTQLRGIITNSLDNAPLKNAQIAITGPKNLTKKSNTAGEYSFKPATKGTYNITVSLDGFETRSIDDFKIKMGKITTLDISLIPA